jgi:hypothetical protein
MKITISWFMISLINLFGANAYASENMCIGGESELFNCDLGRSAASLCMSRTSGLLVYRKGAPKKLELVLSERRYGGGTLFLLSNTQYAGGYESHIRFSNRSVTYLLYDKSVKTDGGPEASAGIVVYEKGQKLANLICENDASFSAKAYEAMRTEDYQPIKAK